MTATEKKDRAAAVCKSCEEIVPVRITPDREIEPIGFSCGCGGGDGESLKILNEEDTHLDEYGE
ncbi:hypothetical protein [Saliphagus sp. LR7]|uniref:hypothetical protein n=1 Tax=Saliphagus sp. LR7 TaxID=2282654 RepID=UPI000DF83934|nr:hypothetical protein [Saliphagus sp. LR7]